MKVKLRERERSLLGVAINKYDRLAKGTQSNLRSLNLPSMAVDTARGNIEAIKELLGMSGADDEEEEGETAERVLPSVAEIEFQEDLRITVRDLLDFALTKYQKAENDQTELLIGTSETEETMNEVRAIRRKFADQGELELMAQAARGEGGAT